MDDVADLQAQLRAAEEPLAAGELVALRPTERDGRTTQVVLTPRFFKLAQRARIWRSSALPITLKNAGYGFDPARARSLGGRDGVFLLDRSHDGPMSRKIYGRFLDRPESGAAEVAEYLESSLDQLQAIRVVSHHLRLLGVLHRGASVDRLVIVDLDRRA